MKKPSAKLYSSIHHDGSERYVIPVDNRSLAIGGDVILRVRHHPDLRIERMFLRTAPDGEQQLLEMERVQKDFDCQWWEIQIPLLNPYIEYRFLLYAPDGPLWLNNAGTHRSTPTDWEDFKLLPGFQAPNWIHDRVFYQIFPDRFYDGDPSNNVKDGEFHYAGYKAASKKWGEDGAVTSRADLVKFFGGDLKGISDKLEELAELGINAIYLNPIFTSFSNHRYDVVDFYNVDPHLGGKEALIDLSNKAKRLGIRLLLDIVPNHCGVENDWFKEAVKDPTAETADFFTFHSHPDDYECWLGVKTLPKLNYKSRKLREVMYSGLDSVFRYWLNPPFSIDGWRIDVANMLARQGKDQMGEEIGLEIREAVKQTNPDAYLLGENFFDAIYQLQGDFLDATMNYSGFLKPVWSWLGDFAVYPKGSREPAISSARWSTKAFALTLTNYRAPLPWIIAQMQYNLLDSHDVPRIITTLKGNMDLVKVAIALLFTYPGVPGIYYGDEIGMQGDERNNRETMIWDDSQWDLDLREYYQELISLRKSSSALQSGGYQELFVGLDTFVYLREGLHDQIILIAHRGPGSSPAGELDVSCGGIPNGSIWIDVVSGTTFIVSNGSILLPEFGPGAIILQRTIEPSSNLHSS